MIKFHFVVRRKVGEDKEILGKISSVGFHIIEQSNTKKGLVRLTPVSKDKFDRLKNGQIVLTPDGLGTIKDSKKRSKIGPVMKSEAVDIQIRGNNRVKSFYNLNQLKLVDIIEDISGDRYPVVSSDYKYLVIDDMPVEFIVNKSQVANLSLSSRDKYSSMKIFSKKQNGTKILTELITKKVNIWNLIGQSK